VSDHPSADSGRLSDQVIVVTGAGSGIGRACATAAFRSGASVVLADIDGEAAKRTGAEVDPDGHRTVVRNIDVTDPGQCADLARAPVEHFGRLDGAVLSAGIANHVALLELTDRAWHEMLAVHLTGTFYCLRAFGRALAGDGHGGSLVYVGSTAADGAGPIGQAHYVAAKAGAQGLVRAAARELGPLGIRVNTVAAGFTRTPMNDGLFTAAEIAQRAAAAPLGRVAEPEDIARMVKFLLSADSGFVTGQTIYVNGGAHFR
jgi:3-oxoacyl-[acyl-carrier protein] reductase